MKYKATKPIRLAVLSLLKIADVPLPRGKDQAKLFGCGQSDSCRDQEDLEQAVDLLKKVLSQSDIAALLENVQTAVAAKEP